VKIASPFREGLLLLCAFNYLKKNNLGAVRTQRTGLATLGSSVVEPCPWEMGGKGAIGADERSCLALKDNESVPSAQHKALRTKRSAGVQWMKPPLSADMHCFLSQALLFTCLIGVHANK